MKSKIMLFKRTFWSGLAARFASCPPRFALLLDLRKTHSQSALFEMVSIAWNKKLDLATGMACLLQRSQGGARSVGDMSVGRCDVADAGLVVQSIESYQIKIDRK